MTVQYLQELNVFAVTKLTIAILFCLCISSGGIRSHAAEFFVFQQAHLWSLEKPWNPQQLCCLRPNTPEQYQLNSIIAMAVS
jgi:hypothetical protein